MHDAADEFDRNQVGAVKRLLYISHRVPYPPDKGERVRGFHEIVALAEQFDVTVAAVRHDRAEEAHANELRRWASDVLLAPPNGCRLLRGGLSALGGRSVTEAYFRSRGLSRQIAAAHRECPFDVAMGYSSGMLPYLLAVDAPMHVMDLVDADSAKWAAYAASGGRLARWTYRREAAAVARLERRAVEGCDAVVAVSQTEADIIGPDVHVVANGVDTDYFSPDGESADLGPAAMVFLGTMSYRPNIEAVCWFVENVWPQLFERVSGAAFVIVGRQPTPAVERLGELDGITVTGDVDDVRPYLRGARGVVCPLQTARGIPNKILESMAVARPVIASPLALQGLDLQVGRDILQALGPEQWIAECERVLSDPSAADALGQAARQCVVASYGWTQRMRPLVSLCGGEPAGGGE